MANEQDVGVLLDFLKRSRGFDFSGYKRASLERRVARRLDAVNVDGYVEYVDYLQVHPDEYALLFNTILINVTGFMRDRAAWDYLSAELLPKLLESRPAGSPLRVWTAGCASGEEAYSAAIALAELMGREEFHKRVKIYATDVDEEALAEARQATYPARALSDLPSETVERYFQQAGEGYAVVPELRRAVIFGRNDLVQDAPISRIDLLTCRNTLMYFNTEVQRKILGRFHYALTERGYLFVGKSEMLVTHSDLFVPVNIKLRVFQKAVLPAVGDRLTNLPPAPAAEANANGDLLSPTLRESAFEAGPVPQLIIDGNGVVAMINEQARKTLGLAPSDVGRPLKDLELSYRPVELRSHIDRAWSEHRAALVEDVTVKTADGDERTMEVQLTPLIMDGEMPAVSVIYRDVTVSKRLENELQVAKSELEEAYEELQSTVEELETTNEELQSTNEELETMNEDLQATNEELETMNEQLRDRGDELDEVNVFLETILTSLGIGVVMLDRELRVQIWNEQAADMWGLRADEARANNFLALDIGLPMDQLKKPIRACVEGECERDHVSVKATNRRGRAIVCELTIVPVRRGESPAGVLLLMEAAPAR